MRDSGFCGSCHQFNFHVQDDGQLVLTDEPMQTTLDEWHDYRSQGGTRSCQQCHMPDGDHRVRGSHDIDYLRAAVSVRVQSNAGVTALVVSSNDVGHNVPTGDLFRHMKLEVAPIGSDDFKIVARFERRYTVQLDPATQRYLKRLTADTTLRPFETRRIPLESQSFRYRLRYFYASDKHLERNPEASHLSVTLHNGASVVEPNG